MTTEELVTELKSLGVADEWAEQLGDTHLVGTTGKRIKMPIMTEGGAFVEVTAKLSDDDHEWIPEWESIRKAG